MKEYLSAIKPIRLDSRLPEKINVGTERGTTLLSKGDRFSFQRNALFLFSLLVKKY